MKKLFLCLLVAFMAIMPFGVKAQIVDPVKWAFSIENVNETEFDLVATATVDPEYHIYSTSMPDMGPMPTVFEIEPNEFYELVGTGRDVTPGQNYYDDILKSVCAVLWHSDLRTALEETDRSAIYCCWRYFLSGLQGRRLCFVGRRLQSEGGWRQWRNACRY